MEELQQPMDFPIKNGGILPFVGKRSCLFYMIINQHEILKKDGAKAQQRY